MKLLEYILGRRRGRDAHRIELEAMNNPLLRDAIEGFDSVEGDHKAALERLRQRIAAQTAEEGAIEGMAGGATKGTTKGVMTEAAKERNGAASGPGKVLSPPRKLRRSLYIWSAAAVLLICLVTGVMIFMLRPEGGAGLQLAVVEASDSTRIHKDVHDTTKVIAQAVPSSKGENRGSEKKTAQEQLSRSDSQVKSLAVPQSKTLEITADMVSQAEETAEVTTKMSADSEEQYSLDEVIAIGYGSRAKMSDLTGSVSGIQAEMQAEKSAKESHIRKETRITEDIKAAQTQQDAVGHFEKYVRENLRPQHDAQGNPAKGTVTAQFKTGPQGQPGKMRIKESLSPEADAEARRLIESWKEWPAGEKFEVRIVF